MESNTKLVEQLEVVVENIPNLFNSRIEVDFHDHIVDSNMEIVENLVMDDLVVVGDELYIA